MRNNFSELGRHSLLAMSGVLQIEQKLGLKFNIRPIIPETLGQLALLPTRAGSVVAPEVPLAVEKHSKWSSRRESGPFRRTVRPLFVRSVLHSTFADLVR